MTPIAPKKVPAKKTAPAPAAVVETLAKPTKLPYPWLLNRAKAAIVNSLDPAIKADVRATLKPITSFTEAMDAAGVYGFPKVQAKRLEWVEEFIAEGVMKPGSRSPAE